MDRKISWKKKKWHKVNEVAVWHFFGVYGQGAEVNTGQCSMWAFCCKPTTSWLDWNCVTGKALLIICNDSVCVGSFFKWHLKNKWDSFALTLLHSITLHYNVKNRSSLENKHTVKQTLVLAHATWQTSTKLNANYIYSRWWETGVKNQGGGNHSDHQETQKGAEQITWNAEGVRLEDTDTKGSDMTRLKHRLVLFHESLFRDWWLFFWMSSTYCHSLLKPWLFNFFYSLFPHCVADVRIYLF